MSTDCRPNRMAFDDRMTEVAGILAAGILRRRRREMNQARERLSAKSEVDVFGEKSSLPPNGESR